MFWFNKKDLENLDPITKKLLEKGKISYGGYSFKVKRERIKIISHRPLGEYDTGERITYLQIICDSCGEKVYQRKIKYENVNRGELEYYPLSSEKEVDKFLNELKTSLEEHVKLHKKIRELEKFF